MSAETGKFVISLDFEIMWGVHDVVTLDIYGEHLRGVHTAIPGMLSIFRKHHIKATFATVGLLFFKTKDELLAACPIQKPQYKNPKLSPYTTEMNKVGNSFQDDPYHFAPQLIAQIKEMPEQEIGTHTFCHYYCLEEGQTITDFAEDIKAAIAIAQKNGLTIKSIVFPRNQFNDDYLKLCASFGITSVRGNETSWLYEARTGANESVIRRALRLVDAYLNISGMHCYTDDYMARAKPYNIPSSRFLRQYKSALKFFEPLRLRRIKNAMTYAAKNNLTYHLWWHPHNFGINQEQNFAFLDKILAHYNTLQHKYNLTNYTMAELADYLDKKHGK
jgi:peptidoglycan/xylan/chitin deacetylase (PgdA/CDA1 family)